MKDKKIIKILLKQINNKKNKKLKKLITKIKFEKKISF